MPSRAHISRKPRPFGVPRSLVLAGLLGLGLFGGSSVLAGELHEVTAVPGKAAVGGKGKTSITLAAKNGWHLNPDAPISVRLTAPAGVTIEKPKLTRKDIATSTADKAEFNVAFEGAEAGAKKVECEASFVICQESACKPIKETVALQIEVTAAGAAAKPGKKAKN